MKIHEHPQGIFFNLHFWNPHKLQLKNFVVINDSAVAALECRHLMQSRSRSSSQRNYITEFHKNDRELLEQINTTVNEMKIEVNYQSRT